ncbi:hypothetical protein ACLOJK_014634 [Asimina triloba]
MSASTTCLGRIAGVPQVGQQELEMSGDGGGVNRAMLASHRVEASTVTGVDGGDYRCDTAVRVEVPGESGAVSLAASDGRPGSIDPGLAVDGDEADGCVPNQR